MPAVILPSGETRYYSSTGVEISGYKGVADAVQLGDEALNLQYNGPGNQPTPWSGQGALPWGAVPTGETRRLGGENFTSVDSTPVNPVGGPRDPDALALFKPADMFGEQTGR